MNHLLQSQLQSYASSGLYPLHMPGHKRRVVPAPGLPAGWDMTEVPGVDDLHDADGILADAMARTAALWGAKRTWYLVNGSTCGILAAIRAAVVSSGRTAVICARNCHKSVYHAIELNRLTAHWLVPPVARTICHWPPPTAGRAVPLLPGQMSSFKARTRHCPA